MFQSSKRRLAALLDVVDDMLVGAPEPDPAPSPAVHPHRRPATVGRPPRRHGAVPARSMHCLSPVRAPAAERRAEDGRALPSG